MNKLTDEELDAAYEDGFDYTPDEGPYTKQALRSVQDAVLKRVVEMLREREKDLRGYLHNFDGATALENMASEIEGRE